MGFLGKVFYKTGKASASRPWTSIFIGLVIVAIGTLGFINFQSTVSFALPISLKSREQLGANPTFTSDRSASGLNDATSILIVELFVNRRTRKSCGCQKPHAPTWSKVTSRRSSASSSASTPGGSLP